MASATDSLLGALGVAVVGGVTLNLLDRFNEHTGVLGVLKKKQVNLANSKVNKWFEPGPEMNWKKDMPLRQRRQNALRAHNGDALEAGHALLALANVTRDEQTKIEATKDYLYFFKLNEAAKE